MLKTLIPSDWADALSDEFEKPYWEPLETFVDNELKKQQIFPPKDKIFAALKFTPIKDVKVLILGQDPYHDDNQAHGLCFSVRDGIKLPPSLRNIYKEFETDLSTPQPTTGCLTHWAKQGILLLNTVLTVRAHQANSHKAKGWEEFTDAVIKAVNEKNTPVIFVLWGGPAQKKTPLIDTSRHHIIKAPHPSPLSAYRGFFGSKPFTKINHLLKQNNQKEIDWIIPEAKPEQLSLF